MGPELALRLVSTAIAALFAVSFVVALAKRADSESVARAWARVLYGSGWAAGFDALLLTTISIAAPGWVAGALAAAQAIKWAAIVAGRRGTRPSSIPSRRD